MNNRINGIKRVTLKKLIQSAFKEQKTPKRILRYFKYVKMAKDAGVVDFRWDRLANEYCYDDFEYPEVPAETKKYFHERGYTTNKIAWFGMTKENMRDYLSDFEFYNVKAYVNGKGVAWFDDKLNTYYLLKPFDKYLPRHFYWVKGNDAFPLDVPEKVVLDKTKAVLQVLEKYPIAAKACKGGHGAGFMKLEKKDGKFYISKQEVPESKMVETIKKLDNYIITEYITPHDYFLNLCGPEIYAVIRVLAVFDKDDGPQITSASIRLGCKNAGVATGYAGCIYAGVNLDDGTIYHALYRPYDHEYKFEPIENHPDTGMRLEGSKIPNFDEFKKLVKDVSAYLPFTPYLTFDVIPHNGGFTILEINSHGQPIIMEAYYPFRLNKYNRRVLNLEDK